MKFNFKSYIVLILAFVLVSNIVKATEHNILPRFPELVLEKEYSQYFKVKDCQAKAIIENDFAITSLKAVLENISEKEVSSSIKFRILYPTSISKIDIKVNGKSFKYNPEQPRYSFSLKPNENITFEMKSNVSINYSIDAVRKALKRKEENEKASIRNKKSAKENGRELGESFMRLFKSNDRFGKRFQVGPLVSKWGLFPVDFEKINLEIRVPENFTVITSFESVWQDISKSKKSTIYRTTDTENYSDAIFLPETDKEEQLKTMKILQSDLFNK